MDKIEAASRILLTAGQHPFGPINNLTQRGYLITIAEMLVKARDLGDDCRSVVARHILEHPQEDAFIIMIGHAETHQPIHAFLVSTNGAKLADVFTSGKFDPHKKVYSWTTSAGEPSKSPILAAVGVQQMLRHLKTGTFSQWSKNFPN